jgi:hypothetical protein
MSRRVKLPGADELFRATRSTAETAAEPHVGRNGAASKASTLSGAAANGSANGTADDAARGPSGRVRHDEKITVYVTADELLDLEHARLTLRRDHGLGVDRGRIVREAIHLAIESVARDGGDSTLVRRLLET